MEAQRAIYQAGCVTNARNKSGKLSEFEVGARFRDINEHTPRGVLPKTLVVLGKALKSRLVLIFWL